MVDLVEGIKHPNDIISVTVNWFNYMVWNLQIGTPIYLDWEIKSEEEWNEFPKHCTQQTNVKLSPLISASSGMNMTFFLFLWGICFFKF